MLSQAIDAGKEYLNDLAAFASGGLVGQGVRLFGYHGS